MFVVPYGRTCFLDDFCMWLELAHGLGGEDITAVLSAILSAYAGLAQPVIAPELLAVADSVLIGGSVSDYPEWQTKMYSYQVLVAALLATSPIIQAGDYRSGPFVRPLVAWSAVHRVFFTDEFFPPGTVLGLDHVGACGHALIVTAKLALAARKAATHVA